MSVDIVAEAESAGANFLAIHTIVVPASTRVGQLLVLIANTRANRTFASFTGGSGGIWNQLGTDAVNNDTLSSGTRVVVYRRPAEAGDIGATITVTLSAADWCGIGLLVVDGHDPVTPFPNTPVKTDGGAATATTKTLTGITTTINGSLVLAVAGGNNNIDNDTLQFTTLPGAPWIEEIDRPATERLNIGVYKQLKDIAGASGSCMVTFEETARAAGIVFAIAPALPINASGFWA